MPAVPHIDRGQACFAQAGDMLQRGDLPGAQAAIHKALALHPREGAYHALLGEIYGRLGKQRLAAKALADARALGWAPPAAVTMEPRLLPLAAAAADEWGPVEARRQLVLSGPQRRALLDGAARCLAQLAAMEQEGHARGAELPPAIREARELLAGGVKGAREAWRAEHHHEEPTAPAAGRQVFTHALGTAPGAMNQGTEVTYLQRLLNVEGFKVAMSGNFDLSTKLAVQKLQEKYKLKKRDGGVSVETRQLLNRLSEKRRETS